jgi:hypothetical protein
MLFETKTLSFSLGFITVTLTMGERRGGQEGALAPLAGQNSMFFDFFERKYCVFRHSFLGIHF